jgi:hypothetical protein
VKKKLRILLLFGVVAAGAAGFAYREVRLRTIPTAAWQCLRHPQQMVLYSIDPARAPSNTDSNVFHKHRILGQTSVTISADQATVDSALRRSVTSWLGISYYCFNPRHGIRVTDGTTTYDFLACFECQSMLVFSGERRIADTGIRGSPDALNAVLRAANIPLAPLHNEH